MLPILSQENDRVHLKNSLLEAVVDKAGRIISLHVSGSQKYSAANLLPS